MSRITPWLIAQGAIVAAACASYGPAEKRSEGSALYQTHCAVCHGESGRGDGPGSALNVPRPRDFATGQFRLISSKRRVPTREDLFETISRGIPGTGMPPWGHLPEAQRRALADTVLDLTKDGIAQQLSGTPEETRIEAEKRLKAERYVAPPMPPSTRERLAHGRQLFVDACVSCHGDNGRGLRDPGWKSAEGEGLGSRDLVAGTFKGGEEPEALFRRIQFGIPGTPMSALEADDPNDVWDLVHYMKSLRQIPPESAPLEPIWMPEAMNAQARLIDHDFHLTMWVTGGVGLCAMGGLVAGLLRFRLKGAGVVPFRPGDRRVFTVWIAIPTVIVLVMIVNSWQVYRKLTAPWPDALKVHVTGKQFFWRFDLPELGAQSTGEIAVPAGRPVHFELGSEDVIHSFFLPHLRMKRDVVPGMTTHLWMAPLSKPGTYPILCNQLCGNNHALMNATLRVLAPADFERWVALRKP